MKTGPWKPQPAFRNYDGWVVARIMLAKHEIAAEIVQRIVAEWVASNADTLARDLNIRPEQFRDAQQHGINFEAMRERYCKK